MAAAAATERVRLGTNVLNAAFYNPTLLARDVATTDRLTGGRLELGLGTGYAKAEFEKTGLPFESAGRRVAHLRSTVETLTTLLSDPDQSPGTAQSRVPILLAGNGDKVLRLAAEHADIVGFTGASTDRDGQMSFNAAVELESRVAFAREAAGDRAADIEWNLLVQVVVVADDADSAAAQLHSEWKPDMGVDEFASLPIILIGTPRQIADKIIDLRARTGLSYFTVFERHMEAFAPVVELLHQP